jgi:hypothetical protein
MKASDEAVWRRPKLANNASHVPVRHLHRCSIQYRYLLLGKEPENNQDQTSSATKQKQKEKGPVTTPFEDLPGWQRRMYEHVHHKQTQYAQNELKDEGKTFYWLKSSLTW